jgi:chromosome segregation ATPase
VRKFTKREHPVINVSPLSILFLMQFLLIFGGCAVFLFLQNKKLRSERAKASCHNDIEHELQQVNELSAWKDMFNALQEKFDHIRGINNKLKDTVTSLIPEAEKSKDYEKLIADIEQSNKELDLCLATMEKDNAELEKKSASYEKQVENLQRKMKEYVSKAEFDKSSAENTGLEMKIKKLKDDLESKTAEYGKLEKNYMWLEKEYNALYDNVNEQKSVL